jgi:LmbE family N-acetylglucosaminyl deacetylase
VKAEAAALANRGVRSLVVAPHPDDETIGSGIWMKRHGSAALRILHLTRGSPLDVGDARKAGFHTRSEYALARQKELRKALHLIGLGDTARDCLGFIDQNLWLHLPRLVARLESLIRRFSPKLVLSPAYEGGHPDHDAAAFAVAAVRRQAKMAFRHLEYRLYHAGPDDAVAADSFLPSATNAIQVIWLTAAERKLKSRMLAAFASQRGFLEWFPIANEQFREAPRYDFTRPPHAGRLLYESWGWKVTGEAWRQQAVLCLRSLGLLAEAHQ